MTLIRCAMSGTGTALDPYTIPLPDYYMVANDEVAKTAIVFVRPQVLPPGVVNLPNTQTIVIQGHTVVTGLGAGAYIAWYKHLDKIYAGKPVQYRPVAV